MKENYLGDKLKELRENAGYTLERVASFFGELKETVQKWECGACEPDIRQLLILSELYGTPIDEIFADFPTEQLVDSKMREEYRMEVYANKLIKRGVC